MNEEPGLLPAEDTLPAVIKPADLDMAAPLAPPPKMTLDEAQKLLDQLDFSPAMKAKNLEAMRILGEGLAIDVPPTALTLTFQTFDQVRKMSEWGIAMANNPRAKAAVRARGARVALEAARLQTMLTSEMVSLSKECGAVRRAAKPKRSAPTFNVNVTQVQAAPPASAIPVASSRGAENQPIIDAAPVPPT